MKGDTRRERMRRLLARRARQGLTYGELSRQTGIPTGTLGWWSAGKEDVSQD